MSAARLGAAAALALLGAGTPALAEAAPAAVTIASSYDVKLCLGVQGRQVAAVDCLTKEGVYWQGSMETLQEEGRLGMVAIASPQADIGAVEARRLAAAAPTECLKASGEGGFMLWPCAQTDSKFQWDPKTMQLKTGGKCLAIDQGKLALAECAVLTGSSGEGPITEEQNGHGAPAVQSWVLLPRERPQVDMLETIQLPLRASGRYIGDNAGTRVKLAGVNWLGVVDASSSKEDPAQVALLLKYLGFNAVRIAFSADTKLAALDKAVEAVTGEKMLVVLCRQSSKLEFVGEEDKKKWLDSLTFMAGRFKNNQRVVGVDLLDGPTLEESTKTVPVWGAAHLEAAGAEAMDFKLADWRTAAAEGAVAVWAGNPDALVVIQGAMYGTDLRHVADRPLSVAQDCLRTRLVYSTQEKKSNSALFGFYAEASGMWNPLEYYDTLEDAVNQASFGAKSERAGQGTAAGAADQGSFEDYQSVREKAAYYLSTDGKAPVWVSELGTTAAQSDSAWWTYTLRALKESDSSWFYAPLGEWKKSPDALWDSIVPEESSRSSVVGWKLQDLVALQQPSPLHPQRLEPPAECAFLEAPNRAIAKEPLSISEFLTTTEFSAVLLGAVGIFVASVLMCCVCVCCGCRRCRGRDKPQWLAPSSPRQMEIPEPEKRGKRSFLSCCSCNRTADQMGVPPEMLMPKSNGTYRQLVGAGS